ncbi:MAG TPA: hypothetical protein VH370_12900 [Humisphaera sp.]|nr:hypothetical protein [Humisphaera sp.]
MKCLGRILWNGLAAISALLCAATLCLWIAWMAGYQPFVGKPSPGVMRNRPAWRQLSATPSGFQFLQYTQFPTELRGPASRTAGFAPWIAAKTGNDRDRKFGGFLWRKKTNLLLVLERSLFRPFIRDDWVPVADGVEFVCAVPYWAIIAVCGTILCWRLRRLPRLVRGVVRLRHGRCIFCGYDLQETPGRCPECGAIPASK